ncbi:hypothetical protein [Gryllotalpicola koreensis]|uniref:hypothetical protein n=1 Tax=Gryllotalpicola koreensis TaxID=993086 RepID=UPI0031D554F3
MTYLINRVLEDVRRRNRDPLYARKYGLTRQSSLHDASLTDDHAVITSFCSSSHDASDARIYRGTQGILLAALAKSRERLEKDL